MKYTYFGFSQRAAVDMGLDLVDLAILRYFVDFKDSGYMVTETVNSETYYWVKYEALIKANPILGINSKRTLARRLKSMADKGVLKRYVKRSGGVFTFYTIGDQYSRLIDDRFTAKPLDSKVQTTGLKSPMGMDSKVQTKDSSIKKDSSNKDVVNANKFYHI